MKTIKHISKALLFLLPVTALAQPVIVDTVYEPAAASESNVDVTSISVDGLTGISLGDAIFGQVVIATAIDSTTPENITPPAGFDCGRGEVIEDNNGYASVEYQCKKPIDANDVANAGVADYYTFSWTTPAEATVFLTAMTNVDPYYFIIEGSVTKSTVSSTSFDSPPATTFRDNALILRLYAANEDRSTTSGPTRVFDVYTSANESVSQGLAYQVQATAGAVPAYTWTIDPAGPNGSATQWVAATAIYYPPATATYNVTKDFTPDNAASVDVQFACTGGDTTYPYTVSASSDTISEASGTSFTVSGFNAANPPTCTVTETVPAGFFASYQGDCDTAAAADGVFDCTIVNATTNATFMVTKEFSDLNDDPVTVTLSCNGGLPLVQSFDIAPGSPVTFTLINFVEGAVDCEITEDDSAIDYTPYYNNGTVVSELSCAYTDVTSGAYRCVITNEPSTFDFVVDFEWDDTAADAIGSVDVSLYCVNVLNSTGGLITTTLSSPDNPYTADATSDVEFEWLAVGAPNDDEDSDGDPIDPTTCWAVVDYIEDMTVEVSGCDSVMVAVGDDEANCTLTATVFFEGIPTLSQYGMAILALLMLGVGFVGMRRFV